MCVDRKTFLKTLNLKKVETQTCKAQGFRRKNKVYWLIRCFVYLNSHRERERERERETERESQKNRKSEP